MHGVETSTELEHILRTRYPSFKRIHIEFDPQTKMSLRKGFAFFANYEDSEFCIKDFEGFRQSSGKPLHVKRTTMKTQYEVASLLRANGVNVPLEQVDQNEGSRNVDMSGFLDLLDNFGFSPDLRNQWAQNFAMMVQQMQAGQQLQPAIPQHTYPLAPANYAQNPIHYNQIFFTQNILSNPYLQSPIPGSKLPQTPVQGAGSLTTSTPQHNPVGQTPSPGYFSQDLAMSTHKTPAGKNLSTPAPLHEPAATKRFKECLQELDKPVLPFTLPSLTCFPCRATSSKRMRIMMQHSWHVT